MTVAIALDDATPTRANTDHEEGRVRVRFRHNFMWPPFVWEVDLVPGSNGFYVPAGWNKFQVRLDSPARATVVTWDLF